MATIRTIAEDTVDHSFLAGIEHTLIWHCGIDSPKAGKLANELMAAATGRSDSLRIIKETTRAKLANALMDVTVKERADLQAGLFG